MPTSGKRMVWKWRRSPSPRNEARLNCPLTRPHRRLHRFIRTLAGVCRVWSRSLRASVSMSMRASRSLRAAGLRGGADRAARAASRGRADPVSDRARRYVPPVRRARMDKSVARSGMLVLGILYIFGAWKTAILLHNVEYPPLRHLSAGRHWLMFGLMVNWIGDTGAYYVGAAVRTAINSRPSSARRRRGKARRRRQWRESFSEWFICRSR